MATKNPFILTLIDPDLNAVADILAKTSAEPVSRLVRRAFEETLQSGRAPVGNALLAGVRSVKLKIHLPHFLNSDIRTSAKAQGLSVSEWTARSIADHVASEMERTGPAFAAETARRKALREAKAHA